jgi:hypothetical protein
MPDLLPTPLDRQVALDHLRPTGIAQELFGNNRLRPARRIE